MTGIFNAANEQLARVLVLVVVSVLVVVREPSP